MPTETFPITPSAAIKPEAPGRGLASVRRALARQYKQARPLAGVFTLTNQANGRVFVGGSLNLEGAMNRMRFELKLRTHRNKPLQKDWLAHGPAQFTFAVVDRIKDREDSCFDYQAELDCMLELWRIDIPCHGDKGYNGATA